MLGSVNSLMDGNALAAVLVANIGALLAVAKGAFNITRALAKIETQHSIMWHVFSSRFNVREGEADDIENIGPPRGKA